jgi:hypothetical protein
VRERERERYIKMPFFKRLKNSVLSINKPPSSNGGGKMNGLAAMNKTTMSSVNTFDSFNTTHLNTTLGTIGNNHNSTTLNTTTNSSSNANNTTLSSITSNTFYSARKDPAYRNLIVYHIDSETEGDFTISVKVFIMELMYLLEIYHDRLLTN